MTKKLCALTTVSTLALTGCLTEPYVHHVDGLNNVPVTGFVSSKKWPVVLRCVDTYTNDIHELGRVLPEQRAAHIDANGVKAYHWAATINIPGECTDQVFVSGTDARSYWSLVYPEQEITKDGTVRYSNASMYAGTQEDLTCALKAWLDSHRFGTAFQRGCYAKYTTNEGTFPYRWLNVRTPYSDALAAQPAAGDNQQPAGGNG